MKLEVGMYVRYDGRIFKLNEHNTKEWKMYFEFIGTDNFQASYNIIDLIEVGDYVNGRLVEYTTNEFIAFGRLDYLYEEDIKSIVTKERYSSVEYRVETN